MEAHITEDRDKQREWSAVFSMQNTVANMVGRWSQFGCTVDTEVPVTSLSTSGVL